MFAIKEKMYAHSVQQRQDSVVGVVTRQRTCRSGARIPSEGKIYLFSILLWILPSLVVKGYRDLVHGVKRPGREFEHSLPSYAEVNHEKKHKACIKWTWTTSSFLCARERELYSMLKEAVVGTPI